MKIYYGIPTLLVDITDICKTTMHDNIIIIPSDDTCRAARLSDPFYGMVKQIMIEHNGLLTAYDQSVMIRIDMQTNIVTTINDTEMIGKLESIQSSLQLWYGSFYEELPEQKMATRFLTGMEKVLEIGGNIGRNSVIIARILQQCNNTNLVTLESHPLYASQLTHNRDINQLQFHIENAALSNRKLIQKDWDTKPSETLEEGYSWVHTITLDALQNKYNIQFDTLVLDCEGAFYYILLDMPEILEHITLIIMENDYHDFSHKQYVDDILRKNQFTLQYFEQGGWGPCSANFFEVWKK